MKKGVNDDEMGDIVKHALDWRCVRGVNFQPIQDAGRNLGYEAKRDRALLSDIRRRIVARFRRVRRARHDPAALQSERDHHRLRPAQRAARSRR